MKTDKSLFRSFTFHASSPMACGLQADFFCSTFVSIKSKTCLPDLAVRSGGRTAGNEAICRTPLNSLRRRGPLSFRLSRLPRWQEVILIAPFLGWSSPWGYDYRRASSDLSMWHFRFLPLGSSDCSSHNSQPWWRNAVPTYLEGA